MLFYLFEFEQNVRKYCQYYPEYPTGEKTKGDTTF